MTTAAPDYSATLESTIFYFDWRLNDGSTRFDPLEAATSADEPNRDRATF